MPRYSPSELYDSLAQTRRGRNVSQGCETGDEERGLCHAGEEAERDDHDDVFGEGERPEADGGEESSADEEGPAAVEVGQSPDEWPQHERRQCERAEGEPGQGLAAADRSGDVEGQGEDRDARTR